MLRKLEHPRIFPPRRQRCGMVMVWMAILIVVFVAIVALAVDWGYAYWTSQKLQNTADAAALAGARQVAFSHEDARAQAQAIAAANEAGGRSISLNSNLTNETTGDIIIGHYEPETRTFTATMEESDANAVAVNARLTADSANGPLALIWGPIFGWDTTQITRWAIAYADHAPGSPAIIALDPDDPASFYLRGEANLDVGDGAVQVNSSSTQAAFFEGSNLTFVHDACNVVGQHTINGRPDVQPVDDFQPDIPDPLANLPEPVIGTTGPMGGQITGTPNVPVQFGPGYYSQGLLMKSTHIVDLRPGIYILDNGFFVEGDCTLTGTNVMFFIRTGAISHKGQGPVYVTPPDADLPGTEVDESIYKGIQFFQARSNTNPALFEGRSIFTGTGPTDTTGAGMFYFPSATLKVGGQHPIYVSGLIANKIEIYGSGLKKVAGGYDTSTTGDIVYLVE